MGMLMATVTSALGKPGGHIFAGSYNASWLKNGLLSPQASQTKAALTNANIIGHVQLKLFPGIGCQWLFYVSEPSKGLLKVPNFRHYGQVSSMSGIKCGLCETMQDLCAYSFGSTGPSNHMGN
jgi:hypothetical protein